MLVLQRIPITEEGAGSRRPSYQDDSSAMGGVCEVVLMAFSVLLIVLTFPLTIFFCIRIVQEYERAVIFRLGRLKSGGAKGPGLFFILPCIDTYRYIDI